jgi:prepilin-type N-terminal cleavage/methylation domain-containing protein
MHKATGKILPSGWRKPPESGPAQGAYATRSGSCPERRAFTLVELLVVMFIIVLLAAIAVLIVPGAVNSQRASQGGAMLQGWIMTAQQRAVLDRAPRGVRLYPDPNNPNYLIRAQYIERPDDFTGGQISGSGQQVVFSGVDLTGGNTDPTLYPVQPGDYLEVQGGGAVHQIKAVSATAVTLVSPLPVPITVPTANYRIERAPRLSGDDPETLPTDIAVDISTNQQFGNPLPMTRNPDGSVSYDILFSPKGEVVYPNTGQPQIILWVHDVTQATPFVADPSLIVIFPRSGRIGAYPVNPDPNYTSGNGLSYPYAFVQ